MVHKARRYRAVPAPYGKSQLYLKPLASTAGQAGACPSRPAAASAASSAASAPCAPLLRPLMPLLPPKTTAGRGSRPSTPPCRRRPSPTPSRTSPRSPRAPTSPPRPTSTSPSTAPPSLGLGSRSRLAGASWCATTCRVGTATTRSRRAGTTRLPTRSGTGTSSTSSSTSPTALSPSRRRAGPTPPTYMASRFWGRSSRSGIKARRFAGRCSRPRLLRRCMLRGSQSWLLPWASMVGWYDAITVNGELDWQNKLNKYNKPFFDFCDGLFANYTWKKNFPQDSVAVAGNRKYDIYMGIDVFGRNTFGGGQWTTNIALDLLKKVDVSTAIFAPGWVYETKQPPDFQSAQNRWWGHVEKSWGILRSYPKQLPFYSDFDQGHGYQVSVEGLQVSSDPWNNISCQSFQPMLKYTGDQVQLQAFMDFMDEPYSGGYCLTIKGSVQQNIILSEQLFNGGLVMEDESIHLFYSVRADANSAVGLSLDLASRKKEGTSILVAEDITTFTRKIQNHKYGSYVKADKAEPHGPDNQDWVLYKATVQSSAGYTLAGINIVCTLKIVGKISPEPEDRISEANTDGSSPYRASLGHMSIRKTDANTEFPPAESWITKGEYISWSSSSNTSKLVSLKISWKLKTTDQPSFRKYNIYVENLTADSNVKASRSHLGVASVDAFYVSNLEVSSEVTSVKFIIQACAHDGSWQKLEECPKFFLIPVPSEL
ncbi:cytosolic endo-beta-N-acetylglucosaminidase 1-like isoform X2 [Phragmites australis]|uniref:cytosolic endo-beta-N-acetylglucosaminidase 1-like isoform X2 n=1 Tax=Phragmites australis TaxID=29695 RepID=UPI002D789710|nr:cytosolic endo-beta-N-acetylglucosaminidase 1-like isoform X2 [Phragmites australis]